MDKFRELHENRGLNLMDKARSDKKLAGILQKKRSSKASNDKSTMLQFKDKGIELYSKDDLAKIAEKRMSGRFDDVETIKSDFEFNEKTLTKESASWLQNQIEEATRVGNLARPRDNNHYDLYGGNNSPQDFLKKMQM